MIAYLSTSTFAQLYRKIDCTAADIGALRKAVYGRALSVPLGLHNLEQIVLVRAASPQTMAAQVRALLSISNWRLLLKPCGTLLADDLQALAAGAERPGPFARGAIQNAITTGISELLESDGEELNEDFVQALDEVRREREALAAGLGEFLGEAGARLTPADAAGGFAEFLRRAAPASAQALAERAGWGNQCRRCGGGAAALGAASVRMWTGAALSLVYARRVEAAPARGEDADELLHAITAAAAADTFVTADARAALWLGRVAVDGLRITDLRGLLTASTEPSASRE